ncbi:glycosyltransferase [Labilibaculum euxinus]|uniref:Glycosyltransferase n=1 Tax=Labilibaculum euxinus TaxID=2686357 RepID=A0A7M4DAF9_9BACT|nr:glycosyltransferase [Labilibaculum euxinus]MUP39638.1 glycosyltransferase [Labilibaculum euxinus]MVB08843.1 glycosyltransferase [Labilibaculum euxinus]
MQKKIRHVLLHIGGNEHGGLRSFTEELYNQLVEENIKVTFLADRNEGYAKYVLSQGRKIENRNTKRVNVFWFFPKINALVHLIFVFIQGKLHAKKIAEILKRFNPDLIIGCGLYSAGAIGPAVAISNHSLVVGQHTVPNENDIFNLRRTITCYFFNKYCNKIVGVSKQAIEVYVPSLTIDYDVVYNCVEKIKESNVKRDQFRRTYNVKGDSLVIGTACRITQARGIDIFVSAAIQFLKKNKSKKIVFVIAGDAPYKKDKIFLDRILKEIESSGYGCFVKYIGFVDMSHFINGIDIYCHTLSKGVESFGLSIFQSAFLNKPLILCKQGGYNELLPLIIGLRYNKESASELSLCLEKVSDVKWISEQRENLKNIDLSIVSDKKKWINKWIGV